MKQIPDFLIKLACFPLVSMSCPLYAQQDPAPTSHPQMGICVHFSNGWYTEPEIPKLIAEAGFSWVREDFYWSAMEKSKGIYAMPANYQKTIDDLHAAGLKILAIFNGGNGLYNPDKYDPEAYALAAAWFAKETEGKVQAIEILNEPHNFGFSKHHGGTWNGVEKNGTVSPWVPKYVELLNVAAPAIKKANPKVKVLGLGGVPPVSFRQLEMGISPAVDGITDHPYSPRLTAEYVPYASSEGILTRDGVATADAKGTFVSQEKMFREQSAKHKGPKEMWLTEWGWPSYQEKKNGNLFAGFTRDAQAKYLLRRSAESLGLGVEMNFLYNFRDNGTDPHNAEHNFGLMDIKMQPKPAYEAIKRFNTVMADFQPGKDLQVQVFPVTAHADRQPVVWDGSKIETDGSLRSYQFVDSQGKPLVLIWSVERAGGDLQPAVADIEIITKTAPTKIRAYEFLTGTSSDVPFQQKGDEIMIRKLSVPDHPVALFLE